MRGAAGPPPGRSPPPPVPTRPGRTAATWAWPDALSETRAANSEAPHPGLASPGSERGLGGAGASLCSAAPPAPPRNPCPARGHTPRKGGQRGTLSGPHESRLRPTPLQRSKASLYRARSGGGDVVRLKNAGTSRRVTKRRAGSPPAARTPVLPKVTSESSGRSPRRVQNPFGPHDREEGPGRSGRPAAGAGGLRFSPCSRLGLGGQKAQQSLGHLVTWDTSRPSRERLAPSARAVRPHPMRMSHVVPTPPFLPSQGTGTEPRPAPEAAAGCPRARPPTAPRAGPPGPAPPCPAGVPAAASHRSEIGRAHV